MNAARLLATLLFAFAAQAVHAQVLTPFSSATGGTVPSPWRVVTLPKIPKHTTYALSEVDGRRAVRADADGSYANVVHPVNADVTSTPTPILNFGWRADRFPAGSNLATRTGDDLAAKVCVLFDVPVDRLSLVDRTKIQLGRRLFDPQLPSATLCYAWDRLLPSGTWIDNAYTNRVRMLVLRSAAGGEHGRWFDERRDLRADFERAFPGESTDRLPTVTAIAFATDADNTGSQAMAWFGDISLSTD